MTKREDTQIDPQKLLSPKAINSTLILASLYLSAFEILKSSIISSCADSFVLFEPIPEDEAKIWIDGLGEEGAKLASSNREDFLERIAKYKQEVGIDYDKRDQIGLIPSSNWLQKIGIFSAEDTELVKTIRDHRNKIAHELPTFVTAKEHDINMELFTSIRNLTHKVGVFTGRGEDVIPNDVPDEDIFSGSLIVIEMIFQAVRTFILETPTEQDNVSK